MLAEILSALDLKVDVTVEGDRQYPSCFAVSDLAAASLGAVGAAITQHLASLGVCARPADVRVDKRLASLWFAQSVHPIGWTMPPVWDAIAGDYQTRDGWIRLHTNLPHHKAAALTVLGIDPKTDASRRQTAAAVKTWNGDHLETDIVAAGGVAAAMRSRSQWQMHPQGQAVAGEALINWTPARPARQSERRPRRERPLDGVRVLDLTRVLAGPVATRTLAGFGADILRIDPPGWDEGIVVPDITLGKRCSYLDLQNKTDRGVFEQLLAGADVLVHGYRPGALAGLGYGTEVRQLLNPNLIDVSLDAYGWSGPWATRRGFDSLVQMSCGIAHAGMEWRGADKPVPLPVQALDHATGYLMAAAAIGALTKAASGGGISNARLSLARTADLLMAHRQADNGLLDKQPVPADFNAAIEPTSWGPANRLKPALNIEGTPMTWQVPAGNLGTAPAAWQA